MGSEFQQSHANFGWQLNAVNWPLVFLSGLFLGTRIFLKISQRRGLWWDDYVLILSWLTLSVQSALWTVNVNLGYGKDIALIPVQNLDKVFLILNIASSLIILANLWSKTSFALTLLRLPLRRMKWAVWFIIISMAVFLGTNAIFVWAQCLTPAQTTIPFTELRCLSNSVMLGYSIFSGVYSAIIDLTLALLPWKFLWNLQMKTGEKIGVTVAMSMGIFAGCAAIMKTTLFPGIKTDINVGIQVVAWSVVESAVSIMAASIPILRALVRQNDSMPPVGYGYETDNSRAYLNSSIRTTQSTLTPPRYMMSRPPANAVGGNLPREKEPVSKNIVTGEVARKQHDWDEPDKTGYEMTSYGTEVRPVDFTA